MGVPVIAARIYNGVTAETLGISPMQFASRRETLDRYLAQSGGRFDPADFQAWLRQDSTGNRGRETRGQSVSIAPLPSGCGCGSGQSTPRQRPSKWAMLKSFAREAAKFAAAGFATVSRDTYRQRLATCEVCSEFAADRRCDVCGCYMDVKALMATTNCQRGKWATATEATYEQV